MKNAFIIFTLFLTLPLSALHYEEQKKVLIGAKTYLFESNKLSDLIEHLDENTLIVLDIDNTIFEPTQQLGSVQWLLHSMKKFQAEGHEKKEAQKLALKDWCFVHRFTKVQPVESTTPALIKQLQEEGYPIIAVTTRGKDELYSTLKELQSIDVDFTRNSSFPKEVEFSGNVTFAKGILFISVEHSKGKLLSNLLNKINYSPRKIVFADDTLAHIKEVAELCRLMNINYVGMRYSGADPHVEAFDPKLAEIQWTFLHQILSDEHATHLLKKTENQ